MLNRSLVAFVAAVVWVAGAAAMLRAAQQASVRHVAAPVATASALTAADSKAVVDKYCVTCHNDRTNTGELSLQNLNFTDVSADREKFEKIARKLGVGAMPPQGMPRPEKATHDALVAWMTGELDRAAPNPGRAILRRLNRTEYANAIRDLLDLNVDVSALLPVDNSSYGFDNIADVLGITPVLMERYLTAARRLSAIAVGDAAEIAPSQDTYKVRPDLSQDQHIEGLPLGTRGGIVATHTFPLDAHYTFQVNLLQTTVNTVIGLEYPHEVVVMVDGVEVARATVGGKDDLTRSFENSEVGANALDFRLTFRVFVKAGPRAIGAAFVQKSAALRPGQLQPFLKTTFDPVDYTGIPHIQWLTVTGPFNQKGPGDTPSRRRIFSCRPSTTAEEQPCATKILNTIARRAYRRPLNDTDTPTLTRFFEEGRKKGSFDAGTDQGDPDGVTPLIYAIINGHYDTASYLLEKGANPNLADGYGRTALFAALDMNRPEWNPRPIPRTNDKTTPLDLVKLALAKGANPNAPLTGKPPNQCGQGCGQAAVEGGTPLWRAARSADVEAVRLLLAAGTDPFTPTREGQTPLMVAAGQGWRDGRSAGAEDDAVETIRQLLAAGVDINEKDTRNETALHGAATRGADKVAKYLVEHGARLDMKDRAGRTPLDVASGVPAEEPSQANNYKTGELRESTAKLLRELMIAANIPIEPYTRPPDAPKAEPAQ